MITHAVINSSNSLYENLADCCASNFWWVNSGCLLRGGRDISLINSEEYYVNYKASMCQQSCVTGAEGENHVNCGGFAQPWMAQWETAAECCLQQLFWMDQSLCVAMSSNAPENRPVTWYVKNQKCVKDCKVSSSDAECGTFVSTGQ